jgi:O-antigen ligase
MTDLVRLLLVLGGVAAVVPVGLIGRTRPWVRFALVGALGFLPFFVQPDLYFASHETYRGTERGFGVTGMDLLALALAVATPPSDEARPLPYRAPLLFYLLPCAASLLVSAEPIFTAFSLFKILRAYFFFWAVVRALRDPKLPPALLTGLGAGIVFEAVLGLKMRYVDGIHQVMGTFEHQNSLGMAVNLVVPILFAVLLYRRNALAAASVAAAGVCIVLTLSRGAMAACAIALGATFLGSVARRGWTARKVWIAIGGTVVAVAIVVKAADTIVSRFVTAPESSAEARDLFADAAWLMVADHPFGVGMNMFSYNLEMAAYAQRAGLAGYDTSGVAHEIYLLTLAEVGWLGLAGYLVLLAAPLVDVARALRHRRADVRTDVVMGCGVGLLAMYAQGLLEWIARQPVQVYLFFLVMALVAALTRQLTRRPRAPTLDTP